MDIEIPINDLQLGVVITWLTGISLSVVCLIIQLLLYYFLPIIRKIDQKILMQLTLARLANTIIEYLTADIGNISNNPLVKTILSVLYVQTDTVLIFWMFVYTKNIYDKVVQVFALQRWTFLQIAVAIWLGSLLIGGLYPLFISLSGSKLYNKVYSIIKFVILSVNVLFFCKIFYVIVNKHCGCNRKFKENLKTCLISFLLVCITSLQVGVTDIFSFYTRNSMVATTFCLINSFQALAISIIFGILSKNIRDLQRAQRFDIINLSRVLSTV